MPLLQAEVIALLLARTSFLAAGQVTLQVRVLDLSLMGCSPLLLRFPLPSMISFLASVLLLVQQLDLLLLLCLLLLLKLLL